MNDTLYEEYMRSVLGYQPMNNYQNTYYNNYDNYEPIQNSMSYRKRGDRQCKGKPRCSFSIDGEADD